MTSISSTPSPILAINGMLRPAYRNRMIRHALKACKINGSVEAARLKQVIDRRKIKVRGAGKNPSQALERDFDALAQKIAQAVANDAELLVALLQVWTTALPELAEATREDLVERQIPIAAIQAEFSHEPITGLWFAIVETICESHQDCDFDDVALMVTCLTGWMPQEPDRDRLGTLIEQTKCTNQRKAAPVTNTASDDGADPSVRLDDSTVHSDDSSVSSVAPETNLWNTFLLTLNGIEADHPIWEAGAPEYFLAEVQLLVAQKRQERDSERKRLTQALESLAAQYEAALHHVIEQSDFSRWSAAACSASAAAALAEQVEQLQAHLE